MEIAGVERAAPRVAMPHHCATFGVHPHRRFDRPRTDRDEHGRALTRPGDEPACVTDDAPAAGRWPPPTRRRRATPRPPCSSDRPGSAGSPRTVRAPPPRPAAARAPSVPYGSMIAAHSPVAVAAAASANVTDVTPAPSTPSTATVAPRRTPPPGSSSAERARRPRAGDLPRRRTGGPAPRPPATGTAPSLRTGSAAVTPDRTEHMFATATDRSRSAGDARYWTGEGLYSRPRASKDQPASSP